MKTPTYIVPCSLWHLVYLCENMRLDEIEQYLALTGAEKYNPGVAALGMGNLMSQGPAFTVIGDGNLPICAGGYTEIIPGVYGSWMVGTQEGWDKYWRRITKATKWLINFMFEDMGARRLQTNALASRTEACWWYEKSLKMVPEGVWPGYGVNGEDVACYGLVKTVAPKVEIVEA